jgi:hypothetical protein
MKVSNEGDYHHAVYAPFAQYIYRDGVGGKGGVGVGGGS